MDDSRIIDLYLSRDETAIEETSRKYGAYCYTVANNILSSHEDAEECVNDTWMRTWNSIPPQRPQALKLFLLRITRNISLDRLKAVKAKKRGGGETELAIEELSECIPGAGDVIDELIEDELSGLIRRFVHSLPDTERAIFVRRYFFLESIKAVADKYGMSEGSVMTRLSRTRKKLRTLIEKEMN
nr:RNA polymerase sigma factor [Clostridia bacterium]